jgi:predicted amidohydrolase YtcJ
VPGEDGLIDIEAGHFAWFMAMEEKGCASMEMLRAATRNIAMAYGQGGDLGTLQPGKIADLLILDRNPLARAVNYRSIDKIIKDGKVIDREALPTNPILTRPEPTEELEQSYKSFLREGWSPMLPMCMCH